MLDGVHYRLAKKFLRIGNEHIVKERILKTFPANTQGRAGSSRQERAARPSMLIEHGSKALRANPWSCLRESARENYGVNGGISLEGRGETFLDKQCDTQIRPPGVQSGDRGSFENNVAQRTRADDQNVRALRKLREQ